VDALRRTLEWAGLDYDEGVGAGGALGPYTQSERLDIYRHHVEKLIDSGHAYECFCSVDSLKELKAQLRAQGHMHGYDGRCRHLSRDDVQQRKRAGHCYTVRFKTQTEKEMLPADLIFGQSQPMAVASGADDFVILKGDGFPTYHLASVVDDHLMEISHVLRGEEWLPSVTKHHQLYRAFGWAPPQFGHLPLLANADGTKLSKRTGDVNVEAYREKGYEPEAIINFLGLMGWDHQAALRKALAEDGGDGKLPAHGRSDSHSMYEVFTLPQLVAAFDINLVTHRRAAVDMNKLDFINKMTIRRKAGRLDADGHLAAIGKVDSHRPSEGGRDDLAHRYQAGLRKLPQLEGNNLIEDFDYVGKVFDVELVSLFSPNYLLLTISPVRSAFRRCRPNRSSSTSRPT
jgi:glutamyl-tRNA synthetase